MLIGHSFGSIDGNTYTGSLEAFQKKYEEGIRIFEVDFATAADGNIVLRHDWDADLQEGISSENIPTSEEFKKILIKGKYTPLTFIDLLQLMEECALGNSNPLFYKASEISEITFSPLFFTFIL